MSLKIGMRSKQITDKLATYIFQMPVRPEAPPIDAQSSSSPLNILTGDVGAVQWHESNIWATPRAASAISAWEGPAWRHGMIADVTSRARTSSIRCASRSASYVVLFDESVAVVIVLSIKL